MAISNIAPANITPAALNQLVETFEEIGDYQHGRTMPRLLKPLDDFQDAYTGTKCPKCGMHLRKPCRRVTCPKRQER